MSQCRSYISSAQRTSRDEKKIYPSITLSRLSGSGAFVIAQELIERLNKTRLPDTPAWTLFDKNLVQQIIEDHHLPKSLESFYSETTHSHLKSIVEEILDLHPDVEKMIEQSCKTIINLLRKGHVIIIGRAANIIGRQFDMVTHVRLVAPLEFRLQHTTKTCGLSPREAVNFIQRADTSRAKYFKRYFGKNINDPLLYDMMLNTESLGFDEAARLICDAVAHGKERKASKSNTAISVFQP
jgi:cytidylate kinase